MPPLIFRVSLLMVSAYELGRGVWYLPPNPNTEALYLPPYPFAVPSMHPQIHTHNLLHQLSPSQTAVLQLSIFISKKAKIFFFPFGYSSWLKWGDRVLGQLWYPRKKQNFTNLVCFICPCFITISIDHLFRSMLILETFTEWLLETGSAHSYHFSCIVTFIFKTMSGIVISISLLSDLKLHVGL